MRIFTITFTPTFEIVDGLGKKGASMSHVGHEVTFDRNIKGIPNRTANSPEKKTP